MTLIHADFRRFFTFFCVNLHQICVFSVPFIARPITELNI